MLELFVFQHGLILVPNSMYCVCLSTFLLVLKEQNNAFVVYKLLQSITKVFIHDIWLQIIPMYVVLRIFVKVIAKFLYYNWLIEMYYSIAACIHFLQKLEVKITNQFSKIWKFNSSKTFLDVSILLLSIYSIV